jgi:hypothetical protein
LKPDPAWPGEACIVHKFQRTPKKDKMQLRDILENLSNNTVDANHAITLDLAVKLLVYMEPGIEMNSTVATQVK